MARSKVIRKRKGLDLPDRVKIDVGILDGDQRYDAGAEGLTDAVLAHAPSLAPVSVGEIAEQHEFGLGVTQRSWLRGWFDSTKEAMKRQATDLFTSTTPNRVGIDRAARLFAVVTEASIKGRITDGKDLPPITNPVTIAEKKARGFDPPYTPLVETGLFLSSIKARAEVQG